MVPNIIGVDARELEGKPTGVGVYLKGILEHLQLPEHIKLQLFFKNAIPKDLQKINAECILLRSGSTNIAWQQWTLGRELTRRKIDLMFSPANTLPWRFNGIQTLTIHDLSYFRYPFWFTARERLAKQMNTSISVRSADRIYADCEYMKAEIMHQFDVPEERIKVASLGVTQREIDASKRNYLRQTRRLAGSRVIMYSGSIFNRRHLPVLIRALKHLDPSYVLIIIGENRTFPYINLANEAELAGVQKQVQLLEYVSDSLLEDYYWMADLFVYLSEYEGFGIPPLEAMSFGVPVLLSNTPAMNTIYKDSAHFINTLNPPAVAGAIQSILSNEEERKRLSEAGRAKAASMTWHETARIIASDWEQLLESGS
ncbi:MAG TPA: glycosyltransferase family 1 protein [Acidobacteriota bacterium]|nr:glycosyltransferase family 1 protein [Acidobacteriota bacterium]